MSQEEPTKNPDQQQAESKVERDLIPTCPTCSEPMPLPTSEISGIPASWLARLVLERGLVQLEAIQECMSLRADPKLADDGVSLGQVLVTRRHLSTDQFLRLLEELRCEREKQNQPERYELQEIVGQGGMGIVWRAYDTQLKRVVALKQLRGAHHIPEDRLQRFHQEARSAARLAHPGIVSVYDVGVESGRHYFTGDFVSGTSLAKKVGQPWQPSEAARIVLEVARALQAAHEAGIVHRDIKPGNILLDQKGRTRLTDFGLAKEFGVEVDFALTVSGQVIGTPHYLSPEQALAKNREIGPASDQFSLGIVLYELLTGVRPFRSKDFHHLYEIIATSPPTSLREYSPELPRDLESICLRMLQKRPRDRYRSTGECIEDLERFLAGTPLRIRPVTQLLLLARKVERHLGLLAGLALLTATVLGAFLLHQARDELESIQQNSRIQTALHPLEDLFEQARLELYTPGATPRDTLDTLEKFLQQTRREALRSPLADTAKTWTLRGHAWLLVGNENRGKAALEHALSMDSADPKTPLSLALLELRHSHLVGMRSGGPIPPRTQSQWRSRVETLLDRLKTEQLPELEQALAQAYRAFLADDRKATNTLCQQAIERHETSPGVEEFWILLARVNTSKIPPLQRLALYTRAIERCPHHPWARFLRGNLQQDLHKKLADYDASLRIHPYLWYVHDNRGVTRDRQGDAAGARADYDRAIDLHPNNPVAYYNRGALSLREEHLAEALDDLDRAIQLQPTMGSAYLQRARTREQLEDIPRAGADYDRATELAPNHSYSFSLRGAFRIRQGDLNGALSDLNRALELDRNNPGAYWDRSQVHRRQNNLLAAFTDLSRFLELKPRQANGWLQRGAVRTQQGDHPGAFRDFQRAVALDPRSWRSRTALGTALLRLGRRPEGTQILQKALQMAPEEHRAPIQKLLFESSKRR